MLSLLKDIFIVKASFARAAKLHWIEKNLAEMNVIGVRSSKLLESDVC